MRQLAFAASCAWVLALSSVPASAQSPRVSTHPDSVRFVTSDVVRFWEVVDQATPENLAGLLQREYIDRGSEGLKGFVTGRIVSGEALARAFQEQRSRYEEARARSLQIASMERAIRAPFYALEFLYPEAVFPTVYFVVGRLNSGGTVSDQGLLIGAEMYGGSEMLPYIVAHELIHFQQGSIPDSARTLLAQSIREGSADFVGELISGKHINTQAHEYGQAHEEELWVEFQERMARRDFGGWLYGDPPGERPSDLGYFMGYQIAQAYYDRAPDKKVAIREILTVQNFERFLADSGYRP